VISDTAVKHKHTVRRSAPRWVSPLPIRVAQGSMKQHRPRDDLCSLLSVHIAAQSNVTHPIFRAGSPHRCGQAFHGPSACGNHVEMCPLSRSSSPELVQAQHMPAPYNFNVDVYFTSASLRQRLPPPLVGCGAHLRPQSMPQRLQAVWCSRAGGLRATSSPPRTLRPGTLHNTI